MNKTNKFKLFIENMLVYGLGGIISKLIPFIMLPVITRLMPNTEYYGLSDLSNTVISFASAIAIMGMYDAMYRMFFEKEEDAYKKKICSTALIFTIGSSVVIFLFLLLAKNWIAEWVFKDREYAYLVYLCAIATLVSATNSIVSAPTRMQNKRKVFLVTNTISPVLSYGISIPLLLNGYYVIALPLASLISGVTLELSFAVLNRDWFCFRNFDRKLLKSMLGIAVPLMPTFLMYWVFNSCDKLMIANILDVAAAGIYSVGAKLGYASQLIYTAFAGGWQYFAFSTMKEGNQIETNSRVFEYLGIISFVATGFICAWSLPIHELLFVGDYVKGYVVSPYLFLSPLLLMLFQIASNQFIVIKKTWPVAVTLLGGAVLNVLLNYLLIPVLGIEGAAVATLAGYVAAVVVCVTVLCRMKLMKVSGRFLVSVCCLIVTMAAWRLFFREAVWVSTVLAVLYMTLNLLLYKKDLAELWDSVRRKGN